MTKTLLFLFGKSIFIFEKKVGEGKSLYQLVFEEIVDSKVLIAVVVSLNCYGAEFMTVPQTLLPYEALDTAILTLSLSRISVETRYKL